MTVYLLKSKNPSKLKQYKQGYNTASGILISNATRLCTKYIIDDEDMLKDVLGIPQVSGIMDYWRHSKP